MNSGRYCRPNVVARLSQSLRGSLLAPINSKFISSNRFIPKNTNVKSRFAPQGTKESNNINVDNSHNLGRSQNKSNELKKVHNKRNSNNSRKQLERESGLRGSSQDRHEPQGSSHKDSSKTKDPIISSNETSKRQTARKSNSTESKTASNQPSLVTEKKKRTVKTLHQSKPTINLPPFISITNFATVLNIRLSQLQKRMQKLGFDNVNHDYILDEETAVLIAEELGFDAVISDQHGVDLFPAPPPVDLAQVPLRPPIVTIMGHVDHGKTTILDYLRKSSIVKGEFGGITQHIGAFSVQMSSSNNKKICFLDTPGHAAFLNMRQRGANVTDLVILVVAADDSVMPQTKEAIKHAKNAGVPLIVALNKMDKEGANADKCIADLAANEVDVEDYGGDTQVIKVSAKTGMGIDKLEEAILTLSEVLDIRASPNDKAEGWIIESQVKKGLGHVATVLVKRGTVKVGTILVAGTKFCKVRSLRDDNGKVVKSAGPGTPIEVLGWKELPEAGDMVLQAESETLAKQVVENRVERVEILKESQDIAIFNEKRIQMHQQAEKDAERQERKMKGLSVDEEEYEAGNSGPAIVNFIVKADVSGSAEAVADSINGLGNKDVESRVLYSAVGPVSDNDIIRAQSAKAKILTFNIKTDKDMLLKAGRFGVEIASHNIIYRLVEQVTQLLTNELEPEIRHKVISEALIKNIFNITGKKGGTTLVAGCKVTNGILSRKDKVKVLRNKESIYEGTFSSMKHHKDEVNESRKDTECGISFKDWDKFEEGDIIQTYQEIVVPRHL